MGLNFPPVHGRSLNCSKSHDCMRNRGKWSSLLVSFHKEAGREAIVLSNPSQAYDLHLCSRNVQDFHRSIGLIINNARDQMKCGLGSFLEQVRVDDTVQLSRKSVQRSWIRETRIALSKFTPYSW